MRRLRRGRARRKWPWRSESMLRRIRRRVRREPLNEAHNICFDGSRTGFRLRHLWRRRRQDAHPGAWRAFADPRTEGRRGGKEWVEKCRDGGLPYIKKKKK